MEQNQRISKFFLICVSLIIIFGLVMVYSSSYIYAKETYGSPRYLILKQMGFVGIGLLLAVFFSQTKLNFWYKFSYFFHLVGVIAILLTLTPLGVTTKGAHRWLNLGGMNFQPAEFIKYTLCFASIQYFNNFHLYSLIKKILYFSVFLLSPLLVLILQPDFGTFTICLLITLFVAFCSDFPRKYFVTILFTGLVAIGALVTAAPYRVRRLLTFLDPWNDPQNSGFQIIQSYLAFANGHIVGLGIGNSNEKLFYLPEAHNDFILSVIGEELGFVGILSIVTLFAFFTFFGLKLSFQPESKINKQIIAVFIFAISLQAILNMCVVLGLVPTKGLNLPFISYGGSSIVANIIVVGFVFSALKIKSQIFDHLNNYYGQRTIG